MKTISITLADKSHIDTISYLENEYFHNEAFDIDSITDDILNKKTYIIEKSGTLIAYFTVEIINKIFYLANIVINEKYRGNGYGKYVLDNICFIAKINNARTVGLHVASENEVARHMYSNYGFEVLANERVKNYYPDRETLYLEKEIE